MRISDWTSAVFPSVLRLLQQRNPAIAPALVADRVFAHDFIEYVTVMEFDGKRIGDRTLLGIVIIRREGRVFHARHLVAQNVDAGIGGDAVLVIARRKTPVYKRNCNHILNEVDAIGGMVDPTRFV